MAEEEAESKYRKSIILVLSILIILPVATLDGHHIAMDMMIHQKKPKYKEKTIVLWH